MEERLIDKYRDKTEKENTASDHLRGNLWDFTAINKPDDYR